MAFGLIVRRMTPYGHWRLQAMTTLIRVASAIKVSAVAVSIDFPDLARTWLTKSLRMPHALAILPLDRASSASRSFASKPFRTASGSGRGATASLRS